MWWEKGVERLEPPLAISVCRDALFKQCHRSTNPSLITATEHLCAGHSASALKDKCPEIPVSKEIVQRLRPV